MKIPTIRLVFDRKRVATKEKKGLVQIEINFCRQRKWISTGVKLYKNQWDDRRHVINNIDSLDLNEWLNDKTFALERWVRENPPFSWQKLKGYLNKEEASDSFVEFVEQTMAARNDIKESTRRAQGRLITMLKEWGGIETFADLTPEKVMDFDNYLHGRRLKKYDMDGKEVVTKMRQESLYGYHKLMKTYIHIAMRKGLVENDPYIMLQFKRGESEPNRYLTAAELEVLETAPMRSGSIARSRDLFVFECYTGLSYSDLREFDFSKVRAEGVDTLLYEGKRIKTGVQYYFVLLPKAIEILQKYDYKLPIVSDEALNRNLKVAAKCAGINKPLASHWARRTAAMMFVNNGIRMEVVARILGHSTTKTTQKFYASISAQTVAEEMGKMK